MKIFGLDLSFQRKAATISLDTLIQRLEAAYETGSGVAVTPDTAMRSPTVQAIVTSVSRALATLPIHVLRKGTNEQGQPVKERLSDHPVQRLLDMPNEWQSRVSYWLDASSWLLRHGNYYAFKAQGNTGPVRRLVPLHPSDVRIEQRDDRSIFFRVSRQSGGTEEYEPAQIHHVRGPARDGLTGDSPIMDVREAIALEIAAESFGATFFGNGAFPALVFNYRDGFSGFKSAEEQEKFIEDFQQKFSGKKRFRALLPPLGLQVEDPINIQNDKNQFLETRKLQRTIIAGAFGIPPHLVGDLERATFSNIEQQNLDFVQKVVLPYARMFEAGMERDLLGVEDRRGGVIIRFNVDGLLRGDFKSRQEGLKIQREASVINPNEWREAEGMNPISPDDGGDTYWQQGPSGQRGPEGDDGATDT